MIEKFSCPFEIIKGKPPYMVNPMTSKVEKSILEFSLMTDDTALVFRNVCGVLNVPEELPHMLKLAYIYKCREISFGSDLLIGYKCPKCKHYMESSVLLENLLEWKLYDNLPEHLKNIKVPEHFGYKEICEVKTHELISIFGLPNDSKLSDVINYNIALKSKVPTLKKSVYAKCICGHHKEIRIDNHKFCLDSLSEHKLLTMYKAYNALAMNGFTKLDVDSMLPFEREVHLSLIKERTSKILNE